MPTFMEVFISHVMKAMVHVMKLGRVAAIGM